MTNLEIDRALARAIGWQPEQMRMWLGGLYVPDGPLVTPFADALPPLFPWRRFSHLDPAVIWRVAERYDCFPFKNINGNWCSQWKYPDFKFRTSVHPIAATAVALAVIAGVKK